MSFLDDQIDDYLMLGLLEDDDSEYDDSFIEEIRQRPAYPGAVDWRYERGGVFYDE